MPTRARSRILGTGSYVPEKVLTNADLEKKVDTSDTWILTRTGIRERRMAARSQATSDLAYEAAVQALRSSGVKARDLNLYLQSRLGAKKAGAMDLNAACTGFIYGLTVADSMIRAGAAGNVLLVGAELLTRFINWNDRGTCILFADGAGAVVMGPSGRSRSEVLTTHLYSDGEQAGLLTIPALGSRKPATPAVLEKNLNHGQTSEDPHVEGHGEYRSLRQHLGGDHPHRPRRSGPQGEDQAG